MHDSNSFDTLDVRELASKAEVRYMERLAEISPDICAQDTHP